MKLKQIRQNAYMPINGVFNSIILKASGKINWKILPNQRGIIHTGWLINEDINGIVSYLDEHYSNQGLILLNNGFVLPKREIIANVYNCTRNTIVIHGGDQILQLCKYDSKVMKVEITLHED